MSRRRATKNHPFMFITYAYDDPDEAPVLDSSPTLERAQKARRFAGYGFTYRVRLLTPGDSKHLPEYGEEVFIEATTRNQR